ncbi:MAG: PASTA domain-containing protein [Actinomycetota bacterium]
MELVASHPEVVVGTTRPTTFSVGRTDGGTLDVRDVQILGAVDRLVAATAVAPARDGIEVSVDLRRVRELPEPGEHTLVVSVGASVVAVSVEVEDERSCVGLTGVIPTLRFDPPSGATVQLQLMNRCGHSVQLDVSASWGDGSWRVESAASIGASSWVDLDVRLDVGAAAAALRDGRLPDDLRVVVGRSGPAGGVELELDVDDFRVEPAVIPPPSLLRRLAAKVPTGAWGLALIGAGVLVGLVIADRSGADDAGVETTTTVTSVETTDSTVDTTVVEATTTTGGSEPRPTPPTSGTQPPPPASVLVDDVIGFEVADAVAMLRESGLEPEVVVDGTDEPADDGRVTAQDVAAGTAVEPGSVVTLTVGELVGEVVPDLTGLPGWQAGEVLNELQRAVGEDRPGYAEDQECVDGATGTVIAQSPPVGTVVSEPFDAGITVTVACAEVPAVLGQNLAEARAELDDWQADGRFYAWDDTCPNPSSEDAAGFVIADVRPGVGVVASFSISCREPDILR